MFGALHAASPSPSSGTLLELAREFTPRIEETEPDLVVLDLSGLGRVWPSMESLGEALVEAVRSRGFEKPHVALAWTRVAARLLARGHAGLTLVPAGAEAAALAPLSLELLGLPEARGRLFRRWGLRTLGDLARLPAIGLAERFGPEGPRLRRLARGEDDGAPLVPAAPLERFEATLEADVDWAVEGLEPLSFLLSRVLETLCQGLRERGRQAVALTLDLLLVDGRRHTRRLASAAPTAEVRTWRTLLLLDLEGHPPGEAVQALSVRAEPTPARSAQLSLIDPALPSPEKLAETLGRLREWTTSGRAGSVRLLDSHRPGAFVLQDFAPGSTTGTKLRPPLWPRVALCCFRPPWPATVRLEGREPAHVEAADIYGAVRERAGPWRVSGDWWDVAWSREEWDVALARGVYRIFRDRLRDQWFVEGELD